jgi:hypothetical protein
MPKEFGTNKADEFEGRAEISTEKLRALFWIPLTRLKEEDCNALEVLCHECTHVVFMRCITADVDDELLTRIQSPILYKLMCRELKIKLAKVKE